MAKVKELSFKDHLINRSGGGYSGRGLGGDTLADFDGDKKLDCLSPNGVLYKGLGTDEEGNLLFEEEGKKVYTKNGVDNVFVTEVRDVDGDGDMDIFIVVTGRDNKNNYFESIVLENLTRKSNFFAPAKKASSKKNASPMNGGLKKKGGGGDSKQHFERPKY